MCALIATLSHHKSFAILCKISIGVDPAFLNNWTFIRLHLGCIQLNIVAYSCITHSLTFDLYVSLSVH